MAIEYVLRIRDGVMDERVRDRLIEAAPGLSILEEHSKNLIFDLESDLLFVWGRYSKYQFSNLGGHSFETNALVWFRHKKHDLHSASLQMLRCVLHLIDHMENDMVLIWQNDAVVLMRVSGELILRKGDEFWQTRECRDMLHGRPCRVMPIRF